VVVPCGIHGCVPNEISKMGFGPLLLVAVPQSVESYTVSVVVDVDVFLHVNRVAGQNGKVGVSLVLFLLSVVHVSVQVSTESVGMIRVNNIGNFFPNGLDGMLASIHAGGQNVIEFRSGITVVTVVTDVAV